MLRDGRRLDLGTLHLPYRTLTDESGQQSLKRGVMVGELREAGPLGTLRNAWYQSIDYVRTVWLSLGDLIRGAVSLNDMAGPIGIWTAGRFFSYSWAAFTTSSPTGVSTRSTWAISIWRASSASLP